MNEYCILNNFTTVLWNVFSVFNGNPEIGNYGIRFFMGMFFSGFLLVVIKMRAIDTMQRKHIVAMVGALLIFIRYTVMAGFEWGYQIGLYNDPILHFLFPPLEHFFYLMGLGCVAYYSLNHYEYYPGMLKKILWFIPIFITIFFIYATMEWKTHFLYEFNTNGNIIKYLECSVDWQSHLIITIMSLYLIIVAIIKYNKNNHYISAFWTLTFIEHCTRTIVFYYGWEPTWLATIFHAVSLWSIPLLILHFVKAYVVKLGFCELCARNAQIK